MIFLDELGAKTILTLLRGGGQRVQSSTRDGHWHTTTMIGSIRIDGTTACMTFEGATDTQVFRIYVERVLRPILRKGDVVMMDNLSPQKSQSTLGLIEQCGAQVHFLPAYSPDLNPIEKIWSKIKTYLRSTEARTTTDLNEAIGAALKCVTRQDATGLPRVAIVLSKQGPVLGGCHRALRAQAPLHPLQEVARTHQEGPGSRPAAVPPLPARDAHRGPHRPG